MTKLRVAVFNDTRWRGHYGCQGVMDVLLAELTVRNLQPVFVWHVTRDWRNHMNELPAPGTIDAIVVNGEGSIHHNNPRAHYLTEIATLAKDHYQIPSFLINATLYKNERTIYQNISDFDAVYVRDRGSLAELQRYGLTGKVVPDLTLSLPEHDENPTRQGITITDSVKTETTEKLRALSRNLRTNYINFLCPPPRPNRHDLGSPRKFMRKLKWHIYGRVSNRQRPDSLSDFLKLIQSNKLVVTGRYHAVTLCLRTATPFIACESNTPKVSWLLNDIFENKFRSVDPHELHGIDFSKYEKFTALETKQLDQFLSDAAVATKAMFDQIAAIIQDHKLSTDKESRVFR